MFKFLGRLSANKTFAFIMACVAAMPPAILYASGQAYDWMNTEWGFYTSFLLIVYIVNAVLMLSYSLFAGKYEVKKPLQIAYLLFCIFTVSMVALSSFYFFWLVTDKTRDLVGFAVFYSVVFILFALFNQSQVNKAARIAVAAVLCTVIIIPAVGRSVDFVTFGLETGAMVLDVGEAYSVVFATNKNAIGFVEYTYGDEDYSAMPAEHGKPKVGRIHAVSIPKEHLNGNRYKIGALEIVREAAYGGQTGDTVYGEPKEFRGTPLEEGRLKAYAFSDWHGNTGVLSTMIAVMNDKPDIVFMLGDANDIETEETIINSVIKAGVILTDGIIPAIYARGNHETRGPASHVLADRLGIPSLYFRTYYEDYAFTVYDCGEDKADIHAEYGGVAAYEPYMKAQLEWSTTTLSVPTQAYHIALCHMPQFGLSNSGLRDAWYTELDRLEVGMLIAGHSHNYKLAKEKAYRNPENAYDPLPFWILQDGGGQSNYIACKIVFKDGNANVIAYNSNGERDNKNVSILK